VLKNHRHINDSPIDGHLFAYKWKSSRRPLTKTAFLHHLAQASRAAGEEPLQGHGIQIGSTLEYLLQGISFEAMKVMGRWASNTFHLYLRKHAQILAPYLQASPQLHLTIVNSSMCIR
jgi:hypothetical protein